MKKALLLILLGFISCEIFAADYDFYVKSNYVNIYYKITCSDISNRTVEVVRGDESYPRPVVIPSSVSYSGKKYTVTGIGDYAFSSNPDLTSISIPNTITYIGEYAFNDTGITNLELPESLITIGRYAFTNNQHLETINFPNSISTVGENPFYKCPSLTHSV